MSIPGLMQTMNQLIQIHITLMELSEQKTKIIVLNKVDQLNQIVNKETSLMKRITELDHQRFNDISDFLIEKGYKPNANITVGDIVKLVVKADEKKHLIDSQRQLLSIIDKLRELNHLNEKLIEQSLKFIDYSLDLLLSPADDDAIYHNPSLNNKGMKRIGMFDSKI
jgi:flagellar biosynthesis/type III secretory pathway chaperone